MPHLTIDTPMTPPYWALLQRRLLEEQCRAIEEFYAHYFDERGYLLCVPRWGGDDGPDDAAENLLNWTMLHALGGDDKVLELYKKGWEGHLRQYTEAKTVEVEMGREGMYYKEFPTVADWFHIGEGLNAFTLQGLSDPHDQKYGVRSRRFAGFYMNEDPQAPNYDAERRIVRSMFNGSRGPLMRKATGLDWAGDPIEIEGRFRLGHGERSYEEMVAHFVDYNDVVGDHPLNLCITTLMLNAFMLGGEKKYREWLVDYVEAWVERTEANGGIIPTNIGLDGTIGGEAGGRWYGGVYGWGFTVIVPQTGELAHRTTASYSRPLYGFGNGLLMTGDQRYVDIWRGVINFVNANGREIDGQMMYPRAYGDYFGEEDWYNFQPKPFSAGAREVYFWSMDRDDLKLLDDDDWIQFLEGSNPDFAVSALENDLDHLRRKVAELRADTTSPDTRLSDDMNHINPATTESLTQQMLGGIPTGRVGFPLHSRLRYFDPARQRAGIPEDVAALVDSMSGDTVSVTLVNTSQIEGRRVVVQAGAYAEHRFGTMRVNGQTAQVDDTHFSVDLPPGCGARLEIETARYVNAPTFAFPWER